MRKRKCKTCGIEFQATGEQRLCPACRAASKRETVVRPRVCTTCGCTFDGGPRARYCPQCRTERRKKADVESKRRAAAGKTRKLGSVDICVLCGGKYIVAGGLQRYCPSCAQEGVRQAVLPRKRQRAAEHLEEIASRKAELKIDSAVCAYCGKSYTSGGPSVTCSPECAREYKRITQGMSDYRRGKRKVPPSHQRYTSGLPQSELTGVSYHRKLGRWQVTHNGKYVGLFATQEEAEAKKIALNEDQPPD